MKKILAFALVSLLFTACSKEDNSSPSATNSISATINGVDYVWNVSPHSDTEPGGIDGSYQSLQMSAYNGTLSTSSGVIITINGIGTITTKTYGEYVNDGDEAATFTFMDNGSPLLYGNANDPSNPLSLKVTKITSTIVEGEFQGSIYQGSDRAKTKKIVTNGKFSMTRE